MTTGTVARVQLVLDIDVPSNWGIDCTMKQVRDQAITDAEGIVRKLGERGVRIVGTPQVTAIHHVVEDRRK